MVALDHDSSPAVRTATEKKNGKVQQPTKIVLHQGILYTVFSRGFSPLFVMLTIAGCEKPVHPKLLAGVRNIDSYKPLAYLIGLV